MSILSRSLRSSAIGVALALGSLTVAQAGEGTAVFPDATRIAAVGGSITEIVYALGEEGKLVARDSTSTYPKAALKLPDIGYMRALSPEGVLSVNPSGILALAGSGPKETVDVLKKASVTFIEVPETYDHQGILDKVRIVGHALGVDDKAATLAKSIDVDLKAAEDLTAKVTERKRVLFILSMEGGKILAAGDHTAANGIIKLAGGVNAMEGVNGYKQLTDEAALTASPDVILMMDTGAPATANADVFANPALAATPAGKTKTLIRMDGSYLLGFGPRTAGSIRDMATALYGYQIKG